MVDGGAALIAIGTLAQILPSIAALLTILWLAIRIWESDTVRGITHRQLKGRYDD
jgi:chromate transport protein ChrA